MTRFYSTSSVSLDEHMNFRLSTLKTAFILAHQMLARRMRLSKMYKAVQRDGWENSLTVLTEVSSVTQTQPSMCAPPRFHRPALTGALPAADDLSVS